MKQIKNDFYRYYGKKLTFGLFIKYFIKCFIIRWTYFYRNSENNFIYLFMYKLMSRKYGLEILSKNIGEGLYIGHPYCITINPNVVIGKNCNIHKGVTIGQENRGKRKGTPTLGDEVWIGVNSTIVGNVKIGNNVLIAPNSYVNVDVPDNSIVFGNPCQIKNKSNATEDYINNKIE